MWENIKFMVDDKFYFKISFANGKFFYSEPDWDGFELLAGAENDFFSRENPVGITFIKDPLGKVIELEHHNGTKNEKLIKVKLLIVLLLLTISYNQYNFTL